MDANLIKIDEDYNAALEEIERLMDARPETPEGDRPYEKLQRALRAEVDEAAWAELYSTRSRPFDRPDTGKIAAKVINHYGDEVLKVFEVSEVVKTTG